MGLKKFSLDETFGSSESGCIPKCFFKNARSKFLKSKNKIYNGVKYVYEDRLFVFNEMTKHI